MTELDEKLLNQKNKNKEYEMKDYLLTKSLKEKDIIIKKLKKDADTFENKTKTKI